MAVKRKAKDTNDVGARKRLSINTTNAKLNGDIVIQEETVTKPSRGKKKSKKDTTQETNVQKQGLASNPEEEFVPEEVVTTEDIEEAAARPPPVNSTYLPIPWKGRLGYACLNTYLRNATPPVFSSRTCRIASILDHRHPLQDPSQPEHSTKNRPDKDQPADIKRGQKWVESLGIANVRDISKMLRWNDKYGIRFMRLSSEMFPFASHLEYGYKLAPFASEALAEAGKVVAELGHRVTTHPGQFTQLGSPRKEVVENAIRDLDYHDEMLTLLKLPEQQDRDAVMIIHMGGTFGNKEETLDRFRVNYARLSPSVKRRLVLENDDMSWSVHDLLPICEELNIPMVLDFHHHNIISDESQIREGTLDIMELFPRIRATWTSKGITQKMHYSEPTASAVTKMQRRKHNPRVATLPPCKDDMDLMIEAKDKEQAVFELMKNFKLPGYQTFNEVIPHVRPDENTKPTARKKKKNPKEEEEPAPVVIPEEEIGMGGPEGRVYWPLGKEEWLRPKKRDIKKRSDVSNEQDVNGENGIGPTAKGQTPKMKRVASKPTPLAESMDKPEAKSRWGKKQINGNPKAQDPSDSTETSEAVVTKGRRGSKKPKIASKPQRPAAPIEASQIPATKAPRRRSKVKVTTETLPVGAHGIVATAARSARRKPRVSYKEEDHSD